MGSFPFEWTPDLDDGLLSAGFHLPPSAIAGDVPAYYDNPADLYTTVLPEQAAPAVPPAAVAAATAAALRREEEEGAGIRLVHLLMSCAGAVQAGDHALAATHLADVRAALAAVSAASGIGRVAAHFAAALSSRLLLSPLPAPPATDHALLYHHFYEACPYLKFAHFTANQAILEAFEGCDRVHVVDFSLMQGLQWPALIQALALRPGGPPFLRITGIGPPSPSGRDELREVGLRLAELARSVRVRFAFRGVAANRLDEVRPWMLQIGHGEAVAVNSVLQLHCLLTNPDIGPAPAPIDTVLDWVVAIRPKIFTVVEQEADHNKPAFLDRFTEALFYYSAVFDSLDAAAAGAAGGGPANALAEVYLQREICDIVCGEGASRVERHEPLAQWRARLSRAGLSPVQLGSNAFRQASMLLSLFSGEGYCVEEAGGCLTLGWHSRPLFSASAWRTVAGDDVAQEENNNNNNKSNSNNGSSDSNNSSSSNSRSGGVRRMFL